MNGHAAHVVILGISGMIVAIWVMLYYEASRFLGRTGALGSGCIGAFSSAIVATVWSRLYPRLSHDPVSWLDQSPPLLVLGGWNE